MADEDENLVLSINADGEAQPPPTAEAKPGGKPPPVPGPSTAPQRGLAELERQIEVERAQRLRVNEDNRRLAAERDRALSWVQEAERRGISTYELYNSEQIKSCGEQIDSLTAQHEAAMSDGDFKTAAEVNKKISRLSGQLALLERDQGALVQQREQLQRQPQPRQQQPQVQQPQVPQSTDPIERAIAGRSKKTQDFLRKHPELVRQDGSLKRQAIDAHEAALDAGFAVESDGYYSHIEGLLGNGQAGETVMPQRNQPAPQVAGPVSRAAGPGAGGGGGAPGTFIMTPKMRRLAEDAGVTPNEWATNYLRLLKEGRITPIT